MAKRFKMSIGFGEYDTDVYDFLQGQKNASALVRHLVRNYMNGTQVKPPEEFEVEIEKPKPSVNNRFSQEKKDALKNLGL